MIHVQRWSWLALWVGLFACSTPYRIVEDPGCVVCRTGRGDLVDARCYGRLSRDAADRWICARAGKLDVCVERTCGGMPPAPAPAPIPPPAEVEAKAKMPARCLECGALLSVRHYEECPLATPDEDDRQPGPEKQPE